MTRFNRAVSVFQAILFIGIFTMAARNVDDPDLWWHLKTGEYIAAHKSVPHTDPFSYTRSGQPWVAQEWLTELGLYDLQRAAGFAGLILASAAILTTAFLLLYLRCNAAPYVAGTVTLWGALATRPVWGVRPQVLSLLLTSLWLLILERAEKNPTLLWWTVPLMLLWVNLHAGFAVGLVVFAIFLLGSLLERALGRQESNRFCWQSALVFAIDVLLVPLNPNGLHMYSYPIETLRSVAMQNYIAEWASPNFHHSEYWPFLLLVLATIIALACCTRCLRLRDLLLLLVTLFASLVSIRMIPLFVLIAVPIVAQRLGPWPRPSPRSNVPIRPLANATIILAVVVVAAYHAGHIIETQYSVETQKFPSGAVAFLQTNPLDGPIFNHYDWGGYLIWKLYPTVRVFIDGRADLHGEELFKDFADAYQLRDAWSNILDRRNIRTVLVPPTSALATGLRANSGWKVSYEDAQATIFTALRSPRPSPR